MIKDFFFVLLFGIAMFCVYVYALDAHDRPTRGSSPGTLDVLMLKDESQNIFEISDSSSEFFNNPEMKIPEAYGFMPGTFNLVDIRSPLATLSIVGEDSGRDGGPSREGTVIFRGPKEGIQFEVSPDHKTITFPDGGSIHF